MQIRDHTVPFSFSWIHKMLTSVCFTMFRLEQPVIKVKTFQTKTQYVFVRRYPNWYTKLKSCPFIHVYITDWIPVCILSAHARWGGWVCVCGCGGAGGGGEEVQLSTLYMDGQCSLFRAVWVAFLVAKVCLYLNEFGYSIFRLLQMEHIVKQNDISTCILCIHDKKEMFCLKFTQVRT